MITARIPELGERVQMGKFATAFRGVWGEVKHVAHNPPPTRMLGRDRLREGYVIPGAEGGANHVEVYILPEDKSLTHNGKRFLIKASPYELDGGALDDRPVIVRG